MLHNHTAYHFCSRSYFNFWSASACWGVRSINFTPQSVYLNSLFYQNCWIPSGVSVETSPQQEQTFGLVCGSRPKTPCLSLLSAISFQCHTHLEEKTLHGNMCVLCQWNVGWVSSCREIGSEQVSLEVIGPRRRTLIWLHLVTSLMMQQWNKVEIINLRKRKCKNIHATSC